MYLNAGNTFRQEQTKSDYIVVAGGGGWSGKFQVVEVQVVLEKIIVGHSPVIPYTASPLATPSSGNYRLQWQQDLSNYSRWWRCW